MSYSTAIMKCPTGKYTIVGSVPVSLTDTLTVTEQEMIDKLLALHITKFQLADCSWYQSEPQFKIGHTFIRRGTKRKDIETIDNIYTTTDYNGNIVSIAYVASHDFGGSKVTDYSVPASTIARSIL